MNIQRWPQTFHRPFEITCRQRRFLDKHLPRDARVNHRAVQRGGNMYLPCQAELFHHSPQLIHIPFFLKKSAGRHFFPYQCSRAQLRRCPLKLLVSYDRERRAWFLSSTHTPALTACWGGESSGVRAGHCAYITSAPEPFVP